MDLKIVGSPSYLLRTLRDLAATERTGPIRECSNCGRIDTPPEVDEFLTYIGGKGYTRIIHCRDIPSCSQRQEGT